MKRPALALTILLCLSPFATTAAKGQTVAALPLQDAIAAAAGDLVLRRYPADGPGGALLIARGDTVLFRGARGEADIDRHVPLRPDSVFRIGSLTKQFAAAGLLTLVEAGKVRLEDPLSRYVPDYPGGDGITLLQLLNHTAGVKNYTRIPGYVTGSIDADLTTAQMIDVFRNEAPDFEPGSGWAYNNSGYVLIGAVIEAASGQPWHAYLQQTLFSPLGMANTGFGQATELSALQVLGYSYEGGQVVPMRPMSLTQAHAAGGLVSNVDDLLTWNRALHEGRVLRNATYTQMVTPFGAAADPAIRYGFGLYRTKVRRNDALEHGGGIFGFISALNYLPGPGITVVVLENDDNGRDGESAANVARRLAAIATGDPYPELRAVAVDTASWRAAEGTYDFGRGITRVLRIVDGTLTVQRGTGPRAGLTPIAVDDFLYEDGFNRLVLGRDGDGAITGVRFFNKGDGEGEIGIRTEDSPPALPVVVAP